MKPSEHFATNDKVYRDARNSLIILNLIFIMSSAGWAELIYFVYKG